MINGYNYPAARDRDVTIAPKQLIGLAARSLLRRSLSLNGTAIETVAGERAIRLDYVTRESSLTNPGTKFSDHDSRRNRPFGFCVTNCATLLQHFAEAIKVEFAKDGDSR